MKLITTHPDYILWVDEKADCSLESGSIVLEHNTGAGNPYYRIYKKGTLKTLLTWKNTVWNNEYWQVKIIAHLPLNNAPLLEGVDLLPELPKQEEDINQLALIEF